jgi:hypothetical protein
LGDDADLFNIYYHITEDGNWEEEHSNVFFRREEDAELADKLGLTVDELLQDKRIPPKMFWSPQSTRTPGA